MANRSPFFCGRWGVSQASLIHASGNRWHIDNDEHTGPVVIFKNGDIPAIGDPVIVYINADTCLRRGWGNHRHRTKMILRVRRYVGELRPEQGTLTIVDTDPQIDRAYRIAEGWWLKDDAGEPAYKYEPRPFSDDEADLGFYVPPMADPTTPSWKD